MKTILVLFIATLSLTAQADFSKSTSTADPALESKGWSVTPELGVTQYDYNESFIGRGVGETALDGRVNGTFLYGVPGVEAGANLGLTLLPLSTSRADSFRYLTGDLYSAYTLPGDAQGLRLRFVGGVFLRKMFVSNDAYGWSSAYGPELYPTLSMELPNAQAVSAFAKILPITNISGFSGGNWEIAVGASYRISPPTDPYQIRLDFDYVSQRLDAGAGFVSRMSALTAGVSYGL